MNTTDFLIRFYPPREYSGGGRSSGPAPAGIRYLPYARQELLQWGTGNFVYQQFYAGSNFAVALIDVQVAEHTVLELHCTRSFNGLQYTLEGYAFAWLAGYGCLYLFKDTYTLQYVPEGQHRVLFPAGSHRCFYVYPGALLANLAADHPPVQQIVTMEEALASAGRLIARLPVTGTIRQWVHQFETLPATNGHTALVLASYVNGLTRCYHQQVTQPVAGLPTAELLSVFMANKLTLPEPRLFHLLRQTWFISPATLERYWSKRHPIAFRSTVNRLRMLLALYLLVVEQYPISQVAGHLGYLNNSDFSRQFKKQLGFPPSAARLHTGL